MKVETTKTGMTIWGDDKLWIIDGSTVLTDGEVVIDTSKFDVIRNDDESTIRLKLKGAS